MTSKQQATNDLSVHHIDGPMLGHLNHFTTKKKSSTSITSNTNITNHLPVATTSLVPILTPPISSIHHQQQHSSDSEDDVINGVDLNNKNQYLIVPNEQRIIVRSAHSGKSITQLTIPSTKSDDTTTSSTTDDNITIRAVTLTWLPIIKDTDNDDTDDDEMSTSSTSDNNTGEWVILAGCNNGIIYEWSISDLSSTNSKEGRVPRRSFQLSSSSDKEGLDLIHLTSPANPADEVTSKYLSLGNGGKAVLYGLVVIKGESKTELIKCEISPCSNKDTTTQDIPLEIQTISSIITSSSSKLYNEQVIQNKHISLKKKDEIFGLIAVYRPSSSKGSNNNNDLEYILDNTNTDTKLSGDVFVVMCSSNGIIIYRDDDSDSNNENDNNDDLSTKLVHFTKLVKSSYYTKEQLYLSSISISPNINDIVIGRSNGHVDLLDNVFENVINYLNQRGSSSSVEHPELITVRRTMHWHAHPVRSLAFITAQGRQYHNKSTAGTVASNNFANPMSLLSGGEESVLVTWQLDRNNHKPSNFIARVGQGGIIHTTYCQYTSRIIVFCSDNSIQCYNGSNYDRVWMEQGLASMSLQEEFEEDEMSRRQKLDVSRRLPKRGPIIMVKDPITSYPMLTNLPGSPGKVHWYDTKSSSVVGTLEVAPYNRVSRRDPTSDPHIPAPTVTHLAVGLNGKDMVTVDTVWTENTSVGASFDLIGPQGDVTPMNVCTSIKFWAHVDSKNTNPSDSRKRRNGDVPMNYELVSSMAAPHGREGEVNALAVAPNGHIACTLSQHEDAFRVWEKSTDPVSNTVYWKCLYKVKTPSGYSNQLSKSSVDGQQLVTFSSDGTVLSVTYGSYVTLWDHASATLLTSVSLDNKARCASQSGCDDAIKTVAFMTKNDDSMLLTTTNQFGIKSPFGGIKGCYFGEDEWSFDAGSFVGKQSVVSDVVLLPDFGNIETKGSNGGHFAVAISLNNGLKTIVCIISRDTGSVACVEGTETPIQWTIEGEVQSLCLENNTDSFVQLIAITKDCQMLLLSCGSEEEGHNTTSSSMEVLSTRDARHAQAPVLKIGATNETNEAQEPAVKKRKVSIGMSRLGGGGSGDKSSGFEFPALNAKFTSSFIAQSLSK